jgi:hypothetical protein
MHTDDASLPFPSAGAATLLVVLLVPRVLRSSRSTAERFSTRFDTIHHIRCCIIVTDH